MSGHKSLSKDERIMAVPFKLVIIGDSCAGKSSLLLKLVDDSFTPSHKVTIGVDFKAKYVMATTPDGEKTIIKLRIWDTAGQERFRSIIKTYYVGSHGVILAFDLTNKESFEYLNGWMIEIEEAGLHTSPIMLVGTKSDLVNSRSVSHEDINIFLQSHKTNGFNIEYMECSSKSGHNINSLFVCLADKLILTEYYKELIGFPQYKKKNGPNVTHMNVEKPHDQLIEVTGQSKCCVIS